MVMTLWWNRGAHRPDLNQHPWLETHNVSSTERFQAKGPNICQLQEDFLCFFMMRGRKRRVFGLWNRWLDRKSHSLGRVLNCNNKRINR